MMTPPTIAIHHARVEVHIVGLICIISGRCPVESIHLHIAYIQASAIAGSRQEDSTGMFQGLPLYIIDVLVRTIACFVIRRIETPFERNPFWTLPIVRQ